MDLSKLYLDTSFPGSYSGADKFFREVKKQYPKSNVTKKKVQQTLRKLEAYSIHKKNIRPKRFRKTWTHAPKDLWQIDLLDLQKFEAENQHFRYLCVVIDCFSRFVWVKPLKNKTSKSIVKSLALLIMTHRPVRIMSDRGSEFMNADVNKMLEAFGPKLYFAYSENKASLVERVQRTLRQKIGRIFTKNDNNNWIDHIEDVVHTYNNSYHSSIKMPPAEVTEKDYVRIRLRLYPGRKNEPPAFRVGQRVRIISYRKAFSKEFEGRWTKEIFRIKAIQDTRPTTYLLEDLDKDPILGTWYQSELQNVN